MTNIAFHNALIYNNGFINGPRSLSSLLQPARTSAFGNERYAGGPFHLVEAN
jgi:hypothetical protein